MSAPKPGVSPAALNVAIFLSGVVLVLAGLAVLCFTKGNEVAAAQAEALGAMLIGIVINKPGSISATSNVNDLPGSGS